jgi:N-dimethylarginine dimethylaminohydrolase
MYGSIDRLVLKHVREAFRGPEAIAAEWQPLGFTAAPDYDAALREYDAFVEAIEPFAKELIFLPSDPRTALDSIYVHDPILPSQAPRQPDGTPSGQAGVILCRMGKPARTGEPRAAARALEACGLAVAGEIREPGLVEGGDIILLGDGVLVAGEGYRTNAEGIRQLRSLLGRAIHEVVTVPLPHWTGPQDVLHLMSLISIVDRDLAVVYSRLVPVPFRRWLLDRGVRLVEVPDEEFGSLGCNVLALAPRVCLAVEGNPQTRRQLERAGATVFTFRGVEIARKGSGGPTCLTRPLGRGR